MRNAGTDISRAIDSGPPHRRTGRLPLHRFDLGDAVEGAAVGKVLITVSD